MPPETRATDAESATRMDPPVVTVVGVIDANYAIKLPWLDQAKFASQRLVGQLADLGMKVIDDKEQYVI